MVKPPLPAAHLSTGFRLTHQPVPTTHRNRQEVRDESVPGTRQGGCGLTRTSRTGSSDTSYLVLPSSLAPRRIGPRHEVGRLWSHSNLAPVRLAPLTLFFRSSLAQSHAPCRYHSPFSRYIHTSVPSSMRQRKYSRANGVSHCSPETRSGPAADSMRTHAS